MMNSKMYITTYSLSNLTGLTTLELGKQNFFDGLPEVIGSMVSLEALYLDECELTRLPQRYVIYSNRIVLLLLIYTCILLLQDITLVKVEFYLNS